MDDIGRRGDSLLFVTLLFVASLLRCFRFTTTLKGRLELFKKGEEASRARLASKEGEGVGLRRRRRNEQGMQRKLGKKERRKEERGKRKEERRGLGAKWDLRLWSEMGFGGERMLMMRFSRRAPRVCLGEHGPG